MLGYATDLFGFKAIQGQLLQRKSSWISLSSVDHLILQTVAIRGRGFRRGMSQPPHPCLVGASHSSSACESCTGLGSSLPAMGWKLPAALPAPFATGMRAEVWLECKPQPILRRFPGGTG